MEVDALTECPSCGGKVALEFSNRCQHCGHMFGKQTPHRPAPPTNTTSNHDHDPDSSFQSYNEFDQYKSPLAQSLSEIVNQLKRHPYQSALIGVAILVVCFSEYCEDYGESESTTGVYIRSGSSGSRTGSSGGFGFGK